MNKTEKGFNVVEGYLTAYFDDKVTDVTAIAKHKSDYFIMRDSSMANDSVAANVE